MTDLEQPAGKDRGHPSRNRTRAWRLVRIWWGLNLLVAGALVAFAARSFLSF